MKRLWAASLCALPVSSVWASELAADQFRGCTSYDGKQGLPAVKAYVAGK